MRRLVDYNPTNGVSTYHHYDADTDTTHIEYVQDNVKEIIEQNKRLQNHHAGGAKGLNEISQKGIKDGWWHVGRLPMWVVLQWKFEKGIDAFKKEHAPAVARLLDDPDWKWLRIGTGKIGKQSRWV